MGSWVTRALALLLLIGAAACASSSDAVGGAAQGRRSANGAPARVLVLAGSGATAEGPARGTIVATTGGRDGTPYCRWHASTCGDAPTPLARGRRDQYGLH